RPAEVEVEQPVLLRVLIQGKGPTEWQPAQEKLKIFPPSAANDFFIEPVPDLKSHAPGTDVWEFVYRLRPKTTEVVAIPTLKLAIYNPDRRRYQQSSADPIPLTVKPPQPKDIEIKLNVLSAPERFFETRADAGFQLWSPWVHRCLESF